jgi:hypothetical protein
MEKQITGVCINEHGEVVSRYYRSMDAAQNQNPKYGVVETSPGTIWRADFLPHRTTAKVVNQKI